uniref:Putative lectin/glucanase superfamily protein n=2 Tax=viral metagenome TaxID=1070528 RepID=A0A6M3IY71_9ZZZZ
MLESQVLEPKGLTDPYLVLDLPLWDLDGSSFKSRDRFGHLCTVTGATWGLQGRKGDGIDDRIVLPSSAALFPAQCTWFTWVKFNVVNDTMYFMSTDAAGSNVGDFGLGFNNTDDKVHLYGYDTGSIDVSPDNACVADTWYCFAVLFGTGGIKYYIATNTTSFALQADSDVSTQAPAETQLLTLMAQRPDGSNALNGIQGDTVIKSRRLSIIELNNLWQETKGRYT